MNRVSSRDHKLVCSWLLLGVIMVLVQIMLGGITRLTGSGLSITRWEIVTGALPPLSEVQWNAEFDQYKQTPQYKHINAGMSLSQFKFIYFWEYVHRLWARMMGFVFLIPFVFFLWRHSLSKATIKRLAVVVGLAALAAIFGWIMVASGLIKRPWVNAYKLTIHLSLGIALFIYLFYTWIREKGFEQFSVPAWLHVRLGWILSLSIVQVVLGGLVSGMKAALNYPTWPDMRGSWIPPVLFEGNHWNANTFLFYEQSDFMPALVQFLHRNTAYVLFLMTVLFALRVRKEKLMAGKESLMLLGIIVAQLLLGIFTLLGSVGSIPVYIGAAHQVMGILFLTYLVFMRLQIIKQHPTT